MTKVKIFPHDKCSPELIESFIREADKPLTWKEIADMYCKVYPNGYLNRYKINSLVKSNPNVIHIGRNSIYTLKEWDGIRRGGTIKEFAIEFLSTKENNTASLTELAEYLHQFRPNSSAKSIVDNLRLDPYKEFKIYSINKTRYVELLKIVKSTYIP